MREFQNQVLCGRLARGIAQECRIVIRFKTPAATVIASGRVTTIASHSQPALSAALGRPPIAAETSASISASPVIPATRAREPDAESDPESSQPARKRQRTADSLMKLSDLEHAPASATASLHNGHGDGAVVATNGHASSSRGAPAGSHLHNTPLFDSSTLDRHEFVRLMIQALRDTGYPCVLLYLSPGPELI